MKQSQNFRGSATLSPRNPQQSRESITTDIMNALSEQGFLESRGEHKLPDCVYRKPGHSVVVKLNSRDGIVSYGNLPFAGARYKDFANFLNSLNTVEAQ